MNGRRLFVSVLIILASAVPAIGADVEVPGTLAHGGFLMGTTAVGAYTIDYNAGTSGQGGSTAITFPGILSAAPTAPVANWIPMGGSPTANCPGSYEDPQAAAGNLCVYERYSSNVNLGVSVAYRCIIWGGSCNNAGKFGAHLAIWSIASGRTISYGSWAVTP